MLVFVMGAFAEMSGDVSRICGIIAHDLARIHVSYYNSDPKRTKGITGSALRRPGGTWRTAAGPVSSSAAPKTSSSTARRTAAQTAQQ